MLEEVKLALRINHSLLDSEIESLIAAARSELIRVGVSVAKASSESDNLIKEAVKTYVKMNMTDDMNKSEKFAESFKYQIDNIRKTSEYMEA